MACADGVERFRPGTTIRLPFLITADGTIVDITDGVVSAIVEPIGGVDILLTVGDGIDIENFNPPVAPAGLEQQPHGFITLTQAQTADLPLGRLTELTILYMTPEAVQTHAPTIWLEGE